MKSGFKKFLPAFVVGMFSGMASAKQKADATDPTQPRPQRKGKSKGGGKGTGFIQKGPRAIRNGTPLGKAIMLYVVENGRVKYGKPDIDGCRALMAKNWHREFMGKV